MLNMNKLLKSVLLIFTVITIMACGLVLPAPTPEGVTQQPAPTKTAPEATQPLPTATPVPTNTPTPVPPPTNSGVTGADENRIKFPPGGTWVEVGAHLKEGSEIRYVLSALKGQVMSVSIEQSWPFIVEVLSATGPLIGPGVEHPFWRGELPASGDYTIIVKTYGTGDFNLRVAINPPGQAYQYFDYVDPQQLFTLTYSDQFSPTTYIPTGDFKGKPDLVLQFIQPEFYVPTTNLSEAYFILSTITDTGKIATCTQPSSQLETITGHKTINGYDFTQSEAIGAAAGNIYDQVIYRTSSNNICYEVVFYMHSGNIGNYAPGTVKEFDRAALLQKFEQILSTFNVQ